MSGETGMLQKILEYELKPALGCTEPMAFALLRCVCAGVRP